MLHPATIEFSGARDLQKTGRLAQNVDAKKPVRAKISATTDAIKNTKTTTATNRQSKQNDDHDEKPHNKTNNHGDSGRQPRPKVVFLWQELLLDAKLADRACFEV